MSQSQTVICLEVCIASHRVEEAVGQAFAMGASGVEVRDAETGHGEATVTVLSWHGGEADGLIAQVRLALGADCTVNASSADIQSWKPNHEHIRYSTDQLVVTDADGPTIEGCLHIKMMSDFGFGGGSHDTTRLGLEALEAMAQKGCLGRVLDYGTGTGILALAAARLGAREVVAVDIDQVALDTAQLNVSANGLESVITLGPPGVESGSFDVVIANLYLGVLINQLEKLAKILSPGAICCITGFTLEHKSIIECTAAEHGLSLVGEIRREPWVLLHMAQGREERKLS